MGTKKKDAAAPHSSPLPLSYHQEFKVMDANGKVFCEVNHVDAAALIVRRVNQGEKMDALLSACLRLRAAMNMNPKAAEEALRDDPSSWTQFTAAIWEASK